MSLQELDELNDFIQKLGEKASKKGIVKEPRDILSENAVISGKKDIAGLKKRIKRVYNGIKRPSRVPSIRKII